METTSGNNFGFRDLADRWCQWESVVWGMVALTVELMGDSLQRGHVRFGK